MLLYLVTKNHSFSDGNKRIAATLFLWFMAGNGILYNPDGSKRIADNTLVALTLMIAESRTDEVQLFNALQKGAVTANRNVAVPQCAYSTVIQLRDWLPDAVGGVCWFGMDNPGQSPRVPIFCGTTDLPEMFKICGNHRYRLDAALWHYRQANKLATVRWGNARKILEKNLLHFERKGLEELPMVEQRYAELVKSQGEEAAKAYLTDYTKDFIGATLLRWDEMTAKYWNDYRFGF